MSKARPACDSWIIKGGSGDLMAKIQRFSEVTKNGRCPRCSNAVLRNANRILGSKRIFAARMRHAYHSLEPRRLLKEIAAESQPPTRRSRASTLIRAAQSLVLRTVCSGRSNQIKCGPCGARYLN